MWAIVIMSISILLETAAAAQALRLIPLTRRKAAWILISLGLTLIIFRRIIRVMNMWNEPADTNDHELFESLVNLALSASFLLGVLWIRPMFESMRRTEDQLRQAGLELDQRVQQRTAELAQSMEGLRQSEEKYRKLFATVTDAITIVDAQTLQVLDGNDAVLRLYGYTAAELVTLHHGDITAEPAESARTIAQVLSGEISRVALRHHRKKDGTVFPVEISASTFLLDGRPVLCAVVRDITERREAEQQVQAAHEALARRAAQLRELSSSLAQAEDRERRRLARALHDDIQQILVAAKINVRMMLDETDPAARREFFRKVESALDESIAFSRSLIRDLSPPILHQGKLAPALASLGQWMKEKYGLAVEIAVEAETNPAAEDVRIFLYQASRELLFNVVKHAQVKQARLRMSPLDNQFVQIIVQDDGQGFDPSVLRSAEVGGMGLFGMRERIELLVGCMTVEAAPGKGTCIALIAPLG